MQSRGTSGPARSGSRSKKLPPAQLEAAIKKLEEAGRRATKAEVRARIAADIRNLRVLLAVKKIKRRETKGSAANPIKTPK